ncbi:hypothetical protein LCI18_013636 [Fusarium solani-melongenae]|uniref:Uncharacterized protein n=1 Tax=Fusarium solani subsp. cucurbitae TaxID=2747967 RepID=A0ACD3ZNC5_FUSSC|nr:hypothetical protein LCI18_013636 [Fusarium solani-melongenae]
MRSYMTKLADVSKLEPVSLYLQRSGVQTVVVHLFGRTRNAPFHHYNRSYNLTTKQWTPWTKMAIEIPHCVTQTGKTGSYLIPAVLGNRLLVFIPQIMMNSQATDVNSVASYSMPEAGKSGEVKGTQVGQRLEIRMSWTECRNGGWTPRQQTSDAITWNFKPTEGPSPIGIDQLMFVALEQEQRTDDSSIAIATCSTRLSDSATDPNGPESTPKVLKTIGTFHFSGGTLSVVGDNVAPGIKPRILQHPQCAASTSTQFFGSRMNGDRVYPTQATYTYDAQNSVFDAKWPSDTTPWIQTIVDSSTNDVSSGLVFPSQTATEPKQEEVRTVFFNKESQTVSAVRVGPQRLSFRPRSSGSGRQVGSVPDLEVFALQGHSEDAPGRLPAGNNLTCYWDSSRQGLMSGERLHFALKQLESAYLEDRGYDYEITKHISLRQLNSLALVSLRETGSCTFTIPEAVFDLDFPGHYLRRIKSISLSVPCVVGPYTSVSTTLRLESNKYRIDLAVRSSYAEDLNSEDHRFSTTRVPLSAIATSSGTDDSGMFEVNFRDERYLPFEGAGAISTWNLELSSALPQFDHQSISNVVMHMRYTAIEGGGTLKDAAKLAIKAALNTEGKCALVDLRNEMANSWASLSAAGEGSDRVITMPRMEALVPFYIRKKRLIATGITILSDVKLSSGTLSGDPAKKINPTSDAPQKDVKLVSGGGSIPGVTTLNGSTTDGLLVEGVWKLKFAKGKPIEANRAWMLITMKSAA